MKKGAFSVVSKNTFILFCLPLFRLERHFFNCEPVKYAMPNVIYYPKSISEFLSREENLENQFKTENARNVA